MLGGWVGCDATDVFDRMGASKMSEQEHKGGGQGWPEGRSRLRMVGWAESQGWGSSAIEYPAYHEE